MVVARADAPICCEDWGVIGMCGVGVQCGGVMAVQWREWVCCPIWRWRLVACAGSGTAGVGVRGTV